MKRDPQWYKRWAEEPDGDEPDQRPPEADDPFELVIDEAVRAALSQRTPLLAAADLPPGGD